MHNISQKLRPTMCADTGGTGGGGGERVTPSQNVERGRPPRNHDFYRFFKKELTKNF